MARTASRFCSGDVGRSELSGRWWLMKDDLRQALRALSKQPGFAAVAVLTLAFGIGINASLFSLISAFFLQPLPVKDAHQLVFLMQKGELINVPYGHSFPDYLDYRAGNDRLQRPGGVHADSGAPRGPGRDAGADVDRGRLPELLRPGRRPRRRSGICSIPGRASRRAPHPTIVLSHRYWQRRFGGDPGIVGRAITLNGKAFTVIGVAPASFTGLSWAMAVSGFVPSGAMPVAHGGRRRPAHEPGRARLADHGTPAARKDPRRGPGRGRGRRPEAGHGLSERAQGRQGDAHPREPRAARSRRPPTSCPSSRSCSRAWWGWSSSSRAPTSRTSCSRARSCARGISRCARPWGRAASASCVSRWWRASSSRSWRERWPWFSRTGRARPWPGSLPPATSPSTPITAGTGGSTSSPSSCPWWPEWEPACGPRSRPRGSS